MALFCRCGKHDDILLQVEKQEKHLLFELLEEAIENNCLTEKILFQSVKTNDLLTEIRELLKEQQHQPGKEVALIIPIGIPVEQ